MNNARPIIVLWGTLALLLAAVVIIRVIHKRGEPPLSSMKVIFDTNGLVRTITVSNQPVATMAYGYETSGMKVADTNVIVRHYDAHGEEITDTNASLSTGK